MTDVPAGPVARITEEELSDGFLPLIGEWENGGFNKHGWNHYGPGYFTLDHETGILTGLTRGHGPALVLRRDVRATSCSGLSSTPLCPTRIPGVFLRVPERSR